MVAARQPAEDKGSKEWIMIFGKSRDSGDRRGASDPLGSVERVRSARWADWERRSGARHGGHKGGAVKLLGVRPQSVAGQAMIMIIVVLMLLMLLPLILYSANSGSLPVVTTNVNSRLAWDAANAGMSNYRNQLDQNISFAQYNEDTHYGAGGSEPMGVYSEFNYAVSGQYSGPSESATPFSCTGPYTQVIPNVRIINWQPVKGTSAPACEHYTVSVAIGTLTLNTASIKVTVTGEAGSKGQVRSYKAVSSVFSRPALDYALNTNFNATNPTRSTLQTDVPVLIHLVEFFDPNIQNALPGGLALTPQFIQEVVDMVCVRYAGQQFSLPGTTITFSGPFPGCPVNTLQAGWSWNGGLPNPIVPSTFSIGQYFRQYQDTINGNVRSNDGLYYCGFPPNHLINWVQLGLNAFGSNWGSLAIDAALATVFYFATGNLSPVSPVINGNIVAGAPVSQGGGGVSQGPIPGIPGGLGSTLALLTGYPSCPSAGPTLTPGSSVTLGGKLEQLPQPNPNLESIASQGGHYIEPGGITVPESPGGCLYQGQAVIILNANGTMTVWNPDTIGINSTYNNGCPSNGGTAALPADGVVYVANEYTHHTCKNFPSYPFTALNSGYGTSQANPIQNQNCSNGNAIIQGTLNGRLTVAAQNDVIITNSIYYGGPNCPGTGSSAVAGQLCNSLLGLTAQGNVEINHPQDLNVNTFTTVLGYISDVCNILSIVAAAASLVGIGIPFAAPIVVICSYLVIAGDLFLLYLVGRNDTDCPSSGLNACSNYGTAANPADDDTTNPNVLAPDPGEAAWFSFENPADLIQDVLDGLQDAAYSAVFGVCGECNKYIYFSIPCSLNFNSWGSASVNWCTHHTCKNFPSYPFTALNSGYGTSQANPIQNQNCSNGNAIIQGTLNGRLTVAAQNDVIITNSIYYGGPNCPGTGSSAVAGQLCNSLLGLTAQGNVEINHPQDLNVNTFTTVLGYISDVCNILSIVAAAASLVGIGIPFAAPIVVICSYLVIAGDLFLLYLVGRNDTDCPSSGLNACSNYGTAANPADDDTTNPNVLAPDPGEAAWFSFENPADLIQDVLDGLQDAAYSAVFGVCGECNKYIYFSIPCSLNFNSWGSASVNWCTVSTLIADESWAIYEWVGESDNPQFNDGSTNWGSVLHDGDGDNWCIPVGQGVDGMVDAAWDWVMNGSWCGGPSSPSWPVDQFIDYFQPDTNFPAFYGEGYVGQQAVVNAIILAAGKQLPNGAYPAYNAVQNSFLSGTSSVCPSWNLNCGMFKVNNSQAGYSMGRLYVNGSVTEYFGGRWTGECQSLGNLFNTTGSTLPFMNCLSNSGYYWSLSFDPRQILESPPHFYGAASPAAASALTWQPVSTGVVNSSAEQALTGAGG
ncbi:MAG: hypothetical protein M1350_05530 [Actinobacteria bacterium]|nr:hypothetical protein [Actinomycetota bacterium]